MQIFIAILIFGLIIVVHELGHFFAARSCGILVEEFAIGMGPKLFGIKRGDTVFSLRLFPIGGSCRMLGEDTSEGVGTDSRSFASKSKTKRFIVLIAGISMNVLLAFVIILAQTASNDFLAPEVAGILEGYPAEEAGLMPGDKIDRINGKKVYIVSDVKFIMDAANGEPVSLRVIRDGKPLEMTLSPLLVADEASGAKRYMIGFSYQPKIGLFSRVAKETEEAFPRAGVFETLKISAYTSVFYVKATVAGVAGLFTQRLNMEEVTGFIGIVNVIGETYSESIEVSAWAAFWNLMSLAAAISVSLAVFNFLPLPALDGGRMLFILIEAVRGKPLNPEREGLIHFAGFVILMIFAVFVAYNDIMRLI